MFYVHGYFAGIYACAPCVCMPGPHGSQERASDAPELSYKKLFVSIVGVES